jgi:hypothetical protein
MEHPWFRPDGYECQSWVHNRQYILPPLSFAQNVFVPQFFTRSTYSSPNPLCMYSLWVRIARLTFTLRSNSVSDGYPLRLRMLAA